MAPGQCELRLTVYNAETLIAAVEIDVWEPEPVLGRVQLAGTQ